MKKSNRKAPFLTYLGAVVLALFLISSSVTSGVYARYSSGPVSSSDEARTAQFDVSETVSITCGGANLNWTADDIQFIPGKDLTYTFTVRNDSEVAVKYSVRAQNITGNLPINEIRTVNGSLAAGDTKTLTCTITWKDTDYLPFCGMSDRILFTLTAEQID